MEVITRTDVDKEFSLLITKCVHNGLYIHRHSSSAQAWNFARVDMTDGIHVYTVAMEEHIYENKYAPGLKIPTIVFVIYKFPYRYGEHYLHPASWYSSVVYTRKFYKIFEKETSPRYVEDLDFVKVFNSREHRKGYD